MSTTIEVGRAPEDVGNILAFHPIHSVIVNKLGESLWHTRGFFEDFDSEFLRDVLLRLDTDASFDYNGGRVVFQLVYAKSISEFPREYTVAAQKTHEHCWIITIADRHMLDLEAAKAERENALLTKMLAIFAHEFRNPLVSVELSTELLRETLHNCNGLPAAAPQKLDAMASSLTQMKRLLDDLDDYHRFSRGKVSLQKQPFDLRTLVEQTIADRRRNGDNHLKWSCAHSEAVIRGDEARVQQALTHLIENAVKFSSASMPIEVRLAKRGHTFVVSIKDYGLGMSHDTLSHVTAPFFQASQGISRGYGGLGLGTYISRTIVEMHGGNLRFHSDGEGKGSQVDMSLPAATLACTHPKVSTPVKEVFAANSGSFHPHAKVLIVEDHETCLDAYKMVLADCHQVEVHYASSAKAALGLLRENTYSLVVTDLGLPDLSGYQLLETYRSERAEHAETEFVLVTGYGSEEERNKSKALGFSGHFVKPLSLDTLRRLVLSHSGHDASHEQRQPH